MIKLYQNGISTRARITRTYNICLFTRVWHKHTCIHVRTEVFITNDSNRAYRTRFGLWKLYYRFFSPWRGGQIVSAM